MAIVIWEKYMYIICIVWEEVILNLLYRTLVCLIFHGYLFNSLLLQKVD